MWASIYYLADDGEKCFFPLDKIKKNKPNPKRQKSPETNQPTHSWKSPQNTQTKSKPHAG